MRSPAAIALVALLAACASAPPFTESQRRAAAVGKSKAEILAEFGEPTQVLDDGAEEALLYVYDRVVLYGPSGPATATAYFCEVTFHLRDGRVASVDAQGADCNS